MHVKGSSDNSVFGRAWALSRKAL